MKTKVTLVIVLLLGATGILALQTLKRSTSARVENEALKTQLVELKDSIERNRESLRRQSVFRTAEQQAEKTELLRLRNEVTQLRANSNLVVTAQSENRRLANEIELLRQRLAAPQSVATFSSAPLPGSINTNGQAAIAADPLGPFRKNPELMRRYFPQLPSLQEKMAPQPIPTLE